MDLWELRDGVFARAFSQSELKHILLLPLNSDGNRTQVNFDTTFDGFTMDLSQDLIVLAGIDRNQQDHGWLRLYSSTTGQAHPQAQKPLLLLKLGFDMEVLTPLSLPLEIKNNLVVSEFASPLECVYEILIWDWVTGRLMHRIGSDNGICSVVFLDSIRLIVWSAHSDDGDDCELVLLNLVVYEQLGCAGPGYDVSDGGMFNIPSFPTLKPAFTFQFPRFESSTSVRPADDFLIRLGYESGSSAAVSSPFAYSRALTLGLMMFVSTTGYIRSLLIYVDTHQLAHHMERAQGRSVSELNWDEWGEYATRWFHARHPTDSTCWMFGSRSLFKDEYLSVVDFHTPTVRRHANRRQDTYFLPKRSEELIEKRLSQIHKGYLPDAFSEHDIEYGQLNELNCSTMDENAVIVDCVTSQEPTTISLFTKPVTSRLPYRMVARVQPLRDHKSWLVTGKQLIGMSPSSEGTTSTDGLTAYTIGGLDDEDVGSL
ncbi:hypothetical protein FRC12_006507 [Ceratobasidium sp. 428]|nr:hypothetical protein FRC12_006507 [Ceratobasidium sp. 428]